MGILVVSPLCVGHTFSQLVKVGAGALVQVIDGILEDFNVICEHAKCPIAYGAKDAPHVLPCVTVVDCQWAVSATYLTQAHTCPECRTLLATNADGVAAVRVPNKVTFTIVHARLVTSLLPFILHHVA